MTPTRSVVPEDLELLRIGEAAEKAGTSCRTLRYYEELGLLRPARHAAGGARRYTEDDVTRLRRIRELQELLGFDLGEIGEILHHEDQLTDLRSEVQAGVTPERRRQILAEAVGINDHLRALVRAKQGRLAAMMHELDVKARRYRAKAKELDSEEGGLEVGDQAPRRTPGRRDRRRYSSRVSGWTAS